MNAETYTPPTFTSNFLSVDPEPLEPIDFGVQRVREGDILVLRCERRIPKDVFDKLKKQMSETFGDAFKVVVLEAGIHVETVLRPDADDE